MADDRPPASPAAPLAGLTVVELGSSVAAPAAAQILGDLGARVIKVEKPGGGDDARRWGPPFDDGVAPLFRLLNRNKRSVTVDLAEPAARARLVRFMLAHADIVIQNLRPGLVGRFGLDAATLRAQKPSLIYCNLSAFGDRGPRAAQPGYDPLMQACGGIMALTGLPGAEPVRVGPSLVDHGAGMWSVIGIVSALFAQTRTGAGATIETSLYETALAWSGSALAAMQVSGRAPARMGTEHPLIAPYRAFRLADGWLVIAAGNDNLFSRLCRALGSFWDRDPRFASNAARVEHRGEINALVAAAVADYPCAALQERLDLAQVPCAPVLELDQIADDPQFQATGLLQRPEDGGRPMIGMPLRIDGERPRLRCSAPEPGEADALLGTDDPPG